ncbi:peroxisomal leader peptide-processing protease [Periplaneta americana]|uniref:peroxisomal leader peptide-processing protease n=1 Tax=Periplaneta americana TaxID=6978 RepID=UPI0037E7E657
MDTCGVLVSCSVSGSDNPVKCSGIRIGRNWILTTGTILNTALQATSDQNNITSWMKKLGVAFDGCHLTSIQDTQLQKSQMTFTVTTSLEANPLNQIASKSSFSIGSLMPVDRKWGIMKPRHRGILWNHQKDVGNPSALAEKHHEVKASLKYVWRSELISQSIDTMMSQWILGSTTSGEEDSATEAESYIAKQLLPLFLVLHIQVDSDENVDQSEINKVLENLRSICDSNEGILRRGQSVTVESTPFGNYYFYNSVSDGIVSNVVGPDNCLVLTDARSALGCEGGPIYVTFRRSGRQRRRLVGMVLCSLSWWRGEWVGFTLGVALRPVLRRLLMPDAPLINSRSLVPPDTSQDRLALIDDCVVLVRCGTGWGSGVVVDTRQGIILTCSHVVRKARNDEVLIYWKDRRFLARLLFRSREGRAYDVAVLKAGPGKTFGSAVLSRTEAVKGEPVVAAGFPLFSEDDNLLPTVTRGVVAHVSDPAAVLQTTCCIQSGASGGPLFRHTGELLGIVSCNTLDTDSGALFPRINMAVPASVLAVPLYTFLCTGDVHALSVMESDDPVVQRLWKLQNVISKL